MQTQQIQNTTGYTDYIGAEDAIASSAKGYTAGYNPYANPMTALCEKAGRGDEGLFWENIMNAIKESGRYELVGEETFSTDITLTVGSLVADPDTESYKGYGRFVVSNGRAVIDTDDYEFFRGFVRELGLSLINGTSPPIAADAACAVISGWAPSKECNEEFDDAFENEYGAIEVIDEVKNGAFFDAGRIEAGSGYGATLCKRRYIISLKNKKVYEGFDESIAVAVYFKIVLASARE